ncbi:ABC transporter substrate-binding protein [Sulfuricurvum sp.]|uniref:ABC transporter substrate-binding protein n=1 Tax=Sulfuricurvum sp. TaxID=2025608 RepID=UPI002612D96B|nr:ABC transporter substrate-binding protein [Sulfuricurvum sp.]MDD3597717.1 ABC transporter substrate-binding protein [Sulfuricurvum sp.]
MQIDSMNYSSHPCKTIIIYPPILWHYLLLEKNDEKVLLVPAYIKAELKHTILNDIFLNINSKKEALISQGAVPNGLEQTLLMHPDIVITWEGLTGGLSLINYQGLRTISNLNNTKNFQEMYHHFGVLTSKEQEVNMLFKTQNEQLKNIGNIYQNKYPISKIIVVSNNNFGVWNNNVTTFNRNLSLINANNIAAKFANNNSINLETIIMLNPDYIFLVNNNLMNITPEDIYKNPLFQSITAIKKRQVYKMPIGICRMDSPVEIPILFQWMAQLIHPSQKQHWNIRNELSDLYTKYFNYKITDEEIDHLLSINENLGSSNYIIYKRKE